VASAAVAAEFRENWNDLILEIDRFLVREARDFHWYLSLHAFRLSDDFRLAVGQRSDQPVGADGNDTARLRRIIGAAREVVQLTRIVDACDEQLLAGIFAANRDPLSVLVGFDPD